MKTSENETPLSQLSRRERQIMDVIIERERCTAQDILQAMPNPPSYSAVRTLLSRMVDKKVLQYTQEGAKYVYFAALDEGKVQKSALARILKTFFKGSRSKAVNALLDMEGEEITSREIADLERTIARLKQKASAREE